MERDTKFTNKKSLRCIWRPFPVCDVVVVVDVEPKFLGSLANISLQLGCRTLTHSAEFLQTSFCFIDGLDPLLRLGVSVSEGFSERGKPRVELDHAWRNQQGAIAGVEIWD